MPVPRRGWVTPVRVCKECFDSSSSGQQADNVTNGNTMLRNQDDIRARKVGEALISTINSAASILDYPKGKSFTVN